MSMSTTRLHLSKMRTKFEGEEFTFRRINTVPALQEPRSAESSTLAEEDQATSDSQWGWVVVPVLILVVLVTGYGIHKRSLKQ